MAYSVQTTWRTVPHRPHGVQTVQTTWRDCISEPVWSRPGVRSVDLSEAAENREAFRDLLGFLTLRKPYHPLSYRVLRGSIFLSAPAPQTIPTRTALFRS